jgi:hypothetical protein
VSSRLSRLDRIVKEVGEAFVYEYDMPIRRSVMSQTSEAQNKAIVLEAFDTLFNKRELGLPFNEFGSQVQRFGPGPPRGRQSLGLMWTIE